MKKSRQLKIISFMLVLTMVVLSIIGCGEKRILIIDDEISTDGGDSSVSTFDDVTSESSEQITVSDIDETMPDNIFASPDTTDLGYIETDIVAEVFECVCVDGLNIQYIQNDPSVGYTYMIVSSFHPNNPIYPAPSATDVIVPDTVDNIGPVIGIGNSAFAGFDIESITIPQSVATIEESAFNSCNALSKVYYLGTELEWALIEIETDNAPLLSATRYYYSETEPAEAGNYWRYVDGVPTVW